MVGYAIYYIGPDVWRLLVKTYWMNHDNWWKNRDEGFVTNCSFVNALFCWSIWMMLRLFIFLMMYVAPVAVVLGLKKYKD